jgi:hypothetical protein
MASLKDLLIMPSMAASHHISPFSMPTDSRWTIPLRIKCNFRNPVFLSTVWILGLVPARGLKNHHGDHVFTFVYICTDVVSGKGNIVFQGISKQIFQNIIRYLLSIIIFSIMYCTIYD